MVIEPQVSYSLLPSQQQLLLRIQHLATLESSLVLVSGRKGAGKHTIASALLDQYGSEFSLAWVTCHEKSSTDSLRQQLLTQLLPKSEPNPSLSLHQHLSVNNPDGPLRWMVVVNQAELMGNPLLVELWGLVEHCRQHPELSQHISIVLFAEPTWARQVAQEMAGITGAELPVLQVPALSLAERKQLFVHLQTCLDDALLDVELSERQLNEQEGLPCEVVALFEPSPVAELRQGDEVEEPSKWQPRKSWLFGLALVPAVLILWWAYQSDEPIEAVRRPAPQPTLAKPDPALLKPHTAVGVASQHEKATPPDQGKMESLPAPVTQVTVTVDAEDESQKQRVEVDEATIQAIEKQQAELAHKLKEPQPAVKEIQAKPVEPKPTELAPQPKPTPPIKPQAWWQQLNSNHFVLQLVLMSSESGLKAFGQQYGLTADPLFRYYPARRNGNVVYIGVYGEYSSKELARTAARSLKVSHSQLSPWPKSAATVKQEALPLD